jgi:hypothetical protein
MFRPLEELIHSYFARIWPIATRENQLLEYLDVYKAQIPCWAVAAPATYPQRSRLRGGREGPAELSPTANSGLPNFSARADSVHLHSGSELAISRAIRFKNLSRITEYGLDVIPYLRYLFIVFFKASITSSWSLSLSKG